MKETCVSTLRLPVQFWCENRYDSLGKVPRVIDYSLGKV